MQNTRIAVRNLVNRCTQCTHFHGDTMKKWHHKEREKAESMSTKEWNKKENLNAIFDGFDWTDKKRKKELKTQSKRNRIQSSVIIQFLNVFANEHWQVNYSFVLNTKPLVHFVSLCLRDFFTRFTMVVGQETETRWANERMRVCSFTLQLARKWTYLHIIKQSYDMIE